MPRGVVNNAAARAAKRVPGLRRLPILKLLAAAEILVLLRDHVERLEPHERRRVVELVRKGRGRASNLSRRERDELTGLVAKAEPRLFVAGAADKLSPVPLPTQLLAGKRP
jgi:hypothetical protein